jgi:DNA-binding transcriptional LysR family regulator
VALHDLSTEEILAGLRSEKLQVALMVHPPPKMLRGLRFQELARYPLCAALPPSHPLAKSREVSLARLADEPMIGYSRKDYPEYHEMLDEIFADERKPRIVEEHDGVSSIIAAVESGRGFALVPQCVESMAGPRVKLIPVKPAPRPIPVGAAWKNDAGMVKEFIRIAGAVEPSGLKLGSVSEA